MQHNRALDGLRGIAILFVILFHAGRLWAGWIGVQIFFVLSGYLITSLLLNDKDLPAGSYMKRFYWRRALRIFPLYYGYLLLFAAFYLILKTPAVFGRDWPYLFTYTLNFRRIFPDFGSNPYYGRFWSLAVEEQFYLIWPTLVYFVPRKYLTGLVLAVIGICPLLRAVAPYLLSGIVTTPAQMGEAIYYLTPCQMDSFATGAALVLIGQSWRRRSGSILIVSTVLLLFCGELHAWLATGRAATTTDFGYGVGMFGGGQHIWGYTLINIWAATCLLAALSSKPAASLLQFRGLTYVGKISYGLYVYHQLLQLWVSDAMGTRGSGKNLVHLAQGNKGFLIYFTFLLAVSSLSYYLYERRFLALKDTRFGRAKRKLTAA